MPTNSYAEQMTRLAVAAERIADGADKPLRGKTYDISTDDKLKLAVVAVVHALGGEVENA